MSELQKQLTEEADRSTQNWGEIASDLIKFHERCLPKRTHADFEVGIAAVKYREERARLIEKLKVSRSEAAKRLREEQNADLQVSIV